MSTKHFPLDRPKHIPKVVDSIVALRNLEEDSRKMTLGIEDLLKIQNAMVAHSWFLAEVEAAYERMWKTVELERKAKYSEIFLGEKEKKKPDSIAKESTNLLIKREQYLELYWKWRFKSVKRVCEICKDARDALKDRIKNARNEKIESKHQT